MSIEHRSVRGTHGATMIALLVIVLFVLLPFILLMLQGNANRIRTSTHLLRTKLDRELLRSTPQEASWAFQEDFYSDHYNQDFLGPNIGRPWRTYHTDRLFLQNLPVIFSSAPAKFISAKSFFTEKQITTDREQVRHLHSLFTFRNDVFRFGLVVENGLTLDTQSPLNNTTITGGAFIGGNLNMPLATLSFSGRPLVVQGNVSAGAGVSLSPGTPVYSSGTVNGLFGLIYSSAPPMDIVPINLNYHLINNRQLVEPILPAVSTSVVWTFQDDPVTGLCRCYTDNPVTNPTAFFEAHDVGGRNRWPVLVVKDGNITLSGNCSSKITVVSFSNITSATTGNVFIQSDMGPPAGFSTDTRSFAVLASNSIVFDNNVTPIRAMGYYRAQQITVTNNTDVTVRGTVHSQLGFNTAVNAKLTVLYDPDLFKNLPPGVPERPVLVTYTSKE